MTTQAVLARLNITRPQLDRLVRNGDLHIANPSDNPLSQRVWRWKFHSADVEHLAAHPPPRKLRTLRTPR